MSDLEVNEFHLTEKTNPSKSKSLANKIKQSKFVCWWIKLWFKFQKKHPNGAKFLLFFIFSIGVTVLQLVLMPLLKGIFANTNLIDINFQIWALGKNLDGSVFYIFDFQSGTIANDGGGGLAFFLAVQIALLVAQVINFFAQRNITFKSDGNPWKAAFWYAFAYVTITVVASIARALYTVPIYNLFMNTLGLGSTGETIADIFTMLIYSSISFLVFFPIFKLIFPQSKEKIALLEAKMNENK